MPTQPQRSSKKLFGVVVLNAVITLSEFIGGIMSGSLSLVSDAFHNLSDTLAIIFFLWSTKMAQKKQIKTYVWLPAFRNIECFHQLIHIDHIILVFNR